ncbi:dpr-interacting protein lambda isoform X2 [Lasioglossum baleicum]
MAARRLAALLTAILQLCLCQKAPEELPEFLAPLENHTVTQGRDVFFTCIVNHLQPYKVAWIKSDSRAILAIHKQLVAHNPRLSVTHNGHNTWKLHVMNVQKNDSGAYMCQVNTDPMRSQKGYMEVLIPPDIVDDESAKGMITPEGGNTRLKCVATGSPQPIVTWRREDGQKIILREDGQRREVPSYEGEILELAGVLRQEMGTYLCIASNNVRPTVSKRYSVVVHFRPVIKVKDELLVAPIGSNVVLRCRVEASPHAMNTWYRNPDGKLLSSDKYVMSDYAVNDYTRQMNLTVNSLEKKDFGEYVCSSENALGKADGVVRLQELFLPVKTTPSPIAKNMDRKPPKKPIISKGKKKNHGGKRPPGNSFDDFDSAGNEDDLSSTQIMGGSTVHEGHRTERPPILPSSSPPWVNKNAAKPKRLSTSITIFSFIFSIMVFLM